MPATNVFDADGHVIEPTDLYFDGLDPAFRDRVEVDALRGEVILEARRVGLVRALFDQTGGHQTFETSRENIARDTEMVVHLIEAMDAQEQLTQHEQAPHVAEHAERPRDRTGSAVDEGIGSRHRRAV